MLSTYIIPKNRLLGNFLRVLVFQAAFNMAAALLRTIASFYVQNPVFFSSNLGRVLLIKILEAGIKITNLPNNYLQTK